MTAYDRWHCRWGCGYKHPVARMVTDHETSCAARPVREVAS